MSTDRIREMEKKIADLQARLERLKDELEKAKKSEQGKMNQGGLARRYQ